MNSETRCPKVGKGQFTAVYSEPLAIPHDAQPYPAMPRTAQAICARPLGWIACLATVVAGAKNWKFGCAQTSLLLAHKSFRQASQHPQITT